MTESSRRALGRLKTSLACVVQEMHVKNHLPSVVIGIGLLVLGTGVWFVVPMLQSPEAAIESQAGEAAERARRTLSQFDSMALTQQQIANDDGLASGVTGDEVAQLVESNSQRAQDVLKEQADRLSDATKECSRAVQELDERLANLDPDAVAGTAVNMRFGTNVPAMSQEMVDGLKRRKQLAMSSNEYLRDALNAASEGLNADENGASGADNLHANRIKGIVLHEQGLAAHRLASLVRSEAVAQLYRLVDICGLLHIDQSKVDVVDSSGVEAIIANRQEAVAELEAERAKVTAVVEELDVKCENLKTKIEEQLAIAQQSRGEMERLESAGIDYGQPDAVERFEVAFADEAERYRRAVSLSQALQRGSVANAVWQERLGNSGGEYVAADGGSLDYQIGLAGFERQLRAEQLRKEGIEQMLADAEESLHRARSLGKAYAADGQNARESSEKLKEQARAAISEYLVLAAKVAEHEDQALRSFKNAASAFKAAQRRAQDRMRDVPSPMPQNSPFELVEQDEWLGGYLACQVAEAQMWRALVLYDRFSHLRRADEALNIIPTDVAAEQIDRDVIAQNMQAAKTEAEEVIGEAIEGFERVGRSLKNHWAVAASVGAADYVLALLDHPEMVAAAIANYTNAVEDRDDPQMRVFKARREQLRNR